MDLSWVAPVLLLSSGNFKSEPGEGDLRAAAWIADHRNRGWPAERGEMVDATKDPHLAAALSEMFLRAVLGVEAIDPAEEVAKADARTGDGGRDLPFQGSTIDAKHNHTTRPWLYMNANQRRRCTADLLVLTWCPRPGVIQTGGWATADEIRGGRKPWWAKVGSELGLPAAELKPIEELLAPLLWR